MARNSFGLFLGMVVIIISITLFLGSNAVPNDEKLQNEHGEKRLQSKQEVVLSYMQLLLSMIALRMRDELRIAQNQ